MKILRISVDNFKMCEKNLTLSFVPMANKTEEDKEFELNEITDNLYTFNTIGIVGKNASGKTTIVDLLTLVYDIFSFFRINFARKIFNFQNKPIHLEITFYHENNLYLYVTDLKKSDNALNNTIIFENQLLYKRLYYKTYAKNLFDYEKYDLVEIDNSLPADTSILYSILNEIKIRGIDCPSEDSFYNDYSSTFDMYKLLNKNYKIIEKILKMFDEHLDNIEMISKDKFKIYYSNKKSIQVTTKELDYLLSSGTTKGIGLFTLIVYSLQNGVDIVIDEIENHFHKTLVENLINLYKDKNVNKNNATLIFTTHYCELLDLFNRSDNIYITKYTDKIKLENMHENYKLRSELLKSKKYYENAFGTDVSYEALMDFKKELM